MGTLGPRGCREHATVEFESNEPVRMKGRAQAVRVYANRARDEGGC
jgi:hypothetical protein